MHTFQLVGGILILILVKKLFDNRNAATAIGKSDAASSSSATQGEDSSSSSFPSSGRDYEVFLSFRGEDTRKTFTDHLYNALDKTGIHTFRDNERLRIGENIDPALRSAIHQSKIAIPIFSKDYASSKWCLRELAEIVKCMKQEGQRPITVMPVFYHVDPSEVRNQTGCYEKAFQDHQKKFGQETEGWKKALKEIGELKGWEPKNIANGHEGKLVQLIVEEVWKELGKSPLFVSDDLVGIHSHVEEMKKLLNVGSDDIRIVGILGLGGIGKTTIARCVYNTIHDHFQGCSFLAEARETFQTRGLVNLQCQLLNNILNLETPNIASVDQGISMIKQRLSNKKVLIVVDDVDQNTDLSGIIGKRDWFGVGSRIIITTRDRSKLRVLGVDNIYEPKEMDLDQSLLLFSKHAFKMDQPPKQYLDLSKAVIKTAGGLPLALEVLGSFLFDEGELVWKETVVKLQKIPNDIVSGKLRISYDGLDRVQKEMFLDIACFFIGMDKDFACYIWAGCCFFPHTGIKVLCDKSLVKIDEYNELRMHDQLRDLGREIVCQENPTNPGERSRLWLQPEVLDVLSTQRGTSKVEGLFIDSGFGIDVQCLKSEGFASMTKLRLLKADYASVAGNFVHSFPELRWLSWKRCPIEFTPTNLRKLVVLDLSFSRITENWMGWNYIKEAETLKVLNLSWCGELSRTPDFSGNLHLETLILEWCENLVTIDESIGHLKRLVSLNLNWCCSLRCLPTSICELSSLKKLDMESSNIGRFPEKFGCLEALREFTVSPLDVRSGYRSFHTLSAAWLPHSIGETLSAEWLPNSIGNWRNLKTLSAEYCNIEEGETLDTIGSLSSLEFLSLEGNPFHSLPATVSALSLLQTLSVAECYKLQSLPSLSHLTNLEELCLDGCENLAEIPTTINALTKLKSLDLRRCHALQYIPVLPSGLTNVDVDECGNLREISAGFSNMRNLVRLFVNKCPRLAKIESLEGLYSLEKFIIINCYALREIEGFEEGLDSLEWLTIKECCSLRKISKLSCLKNLVCIEITDCNELFEIEGFEEGLDSLERLTIKKCCSLRKIPKLSCLKNLVCIEITDCNELSEIEGFEEGLDSLERLTIKECCSLRKISKLSCSKNLVRIEIRHCNELSEIEGFEEGLDSLKMLIISGCGSLRKIPKLSSSKNLVHIEITCCNELSQIEGYEEGFDSLEKLIVDSCSSLRKIPNLSYSKNLVYIAIRDCRELCEIEELKGLYSLKKLVITGCHSLREIPNLSDSKNLGWICILFCHELSEIKGLKGLDSLEKLIVNQCRSLRKIPNLSYSKNLECIEIEGCQELSEIEELKGLYSLEKLIITGCHSLRKIPKLSRSKNCVHIKIRDCYELSEIEGLEEGMDSLKKLTVDECHSLRKIPNLSYSKKLVRIEIKGCHELFEIEELKGLNSLKKLIIKGCHSLRKIPNLSDSKNLVSIEISFCHELSEIEGLKGLDSLEELQLRISQCHSLTKIHLPKKLSKLVVSKCPKFDEIEGLEDLEAWREFILEGLEELSTIRLPYSSNLKTLEVLSVLGLKMLLEFPSVDKLESLEILDVGWCTSIERLLDLSNLTKLRELRIHNCLKLTEIQGVDRLENLKRLCIDGCISIETLPCLSNLRNLRKLSVTNCKKLTEIQGVDKLVSLTDLCIDGCISIEALPCLSNLEKLQNLSAVDCKKLTKIQEVDKLESMKLEAFDARNSNESSSSRTSYSELEIRDGDSFLAPDPGLEISDDDSSSVPDSNESSSSRTSYSELEIREGESQSIAGLTWSTEELQPLIIPGDCQLIFSAVEVL